MHHAFCLMHKTKFLKWNHLYMYKIIYKWITDFIKTMYNYADYWFYFGSSLNGNNLYDNFQIGIVLCKLTKKIWEICEEIFEVNLNGFFF